VGESRGSSRCGFVLVGSSHALLYMQVAVGERISDGSSVLRTSQLRVCGVNLAVPCSSGLCLGRGRGI
jgi:hypothetical protein